MKYIFTPLNLIGLFLILSAIYSAIFPGPMGFGRLALAYILPFGILSLFLDFIAQKFFPKYLQVILVEIALLGAIGLVYSRTQRTKVFIVPDERSFDYVVTLYGVEDANQLPIHFLKWRYLKEVPTNGIVLTSTALEGDLPKTKMYTQSGIDFQSSNDSLGLCFTLANTAEIQVATNSYSYQAWKIGEGGAVSYSSDEIQDLEQQLINYLKNTN